MVGIILILTCFVLVICLALSYSAADFSSRDQMVDSCLLGKNSPPNKDNHQRKKAWWIIGRDAPARSSSKNQEIGSASV
jgi:hypothetical protein